MLLATLVASSLLALLQTPDPGRQVFASRCASCHGTDGGGGELGPAIAGRIPARTDEELASVVRRGLPGAGMPAFPNVSDAEIADLVRHLRTLRPRSGTGQVHTTITLAGGGSLSGLVVNQSAADLQLVGDDRRIHLLRKSGDRYRAVTSQEDWPGYNGATRGYRSSALAQITAQNVSRLVPKWIFSLNNAPRLQVTPVVVGGVMYVTSANECYALDAGAGREIWHYQRPRTIIRSGETYADEPPIGMATSRSRFAVDSEWSGIVSRAVCSETTNPSGVRTPSLSR